MWLEIFSNSNSNSMCSLGTFWTCSICHNHAFKKIHPLLPCVANLNTRRHPVGSRRASACPVVSCCVEAKRKHGSSSLVIQVAEFQEWWKDLNVTMENTSGCCKRQQLFTVLSMVFIFFWPGRDYCKGRIEKPRDYSSSSDTKGIELHHLHHITFLCASGSRRCFHKESAECIGRSPWSRISNRFALWHASELLTGAWRGPKGQPANHRSWLFLWSRYVISACADGEIVGGAGCHSNFCLETPSTRYFGQTVYVGADLRR